MVETSINDLKTTDKHIETAGKRVKLGKNG